MIAGCDTQPLDLERDPDWIAAERAVIEQFAPDNEQRARCFMSLADAVLALLGGDTNAAERHWHDLLAVSSEPGFGLLWVDALGGFGDLRGAGRCDRRSGAVGRRRPVRAAGPGTTGTGTLALASCPSGSDEGRELSLEEATAYARRSHGATSSASRGLGRSDTDRAKVAGAVADGLTNQQAAARLFMSVPTVKTHLRHIFAKLEIDNRSQLVAEVANDTR